MFNSLFPAAKLSTIQIKGVEKRKDVFRHCILTAYRFNYEQCPKQEIGNKFKGARANRFAQNSVAKINFFGQFRVFDLEMWLQDKNRR